MEQSGSHLRYMAYVLRVWQEEAASSRSLKVWRFSLQDARTGQRHGFTNLDSLNEFLFREMAGKSAGVAQIENGIANGTIITSGEPSPADADG